MIFGYGDELADEYKEIEKLNHNEYLKNVKSINYLKTDNYKNLLDFINSDYYQVCIFGHSCGNSDRTLTKVFWEEFDFFSLNRWFCALFLVISKIQSIFTPLLFSNQAVDTK